MAFIIQNIGRAQVFTKALQQRFLSLQTLPAYRRRLNSPKPSFIQSSKFHHSVVHSRNGTHLKMKPSFKQWTSSLELSGHIVYVPPVSNFHHSALHTSRNGPAQLKTKPTFIMWNSSLERSGRTFFPSTNFHHLAENTMNSNAAYLKNLGAFILKPTETNIGILQHMGVKIHYIYSLSPKEKKETGFMKNVSTKVTETEETH